VRTASDAADGDFGARSQAEDDRPAPGHKIFPYLPRDLVIDRPNQVWAADITYIPNGRGFLYLVAIIDWASRAVLSWRLSNTMDVSFCVSALEEALARFGKPEIFNTDQGSQFTSTAFTGTLARRNPDFDGRPRPLDGQHFHRTAVALAQIRGGVLEGLCRRVRCQGRHWLLDRILQSAASASGAGEPDTDGGLA
jgi:transposase InsO family protein